MADEGKIRKSWDNVDKHLAKGNIDRAIKELGKLLEMDPGQIKAHVKLGELHIKAKRIPDAVEAWTRAAKEYEANKHLLEALRTYRQILLLDNTSIDTHLNLASALANQLHLTGEAVGHYHQAAQLCVAGGDTARALELLKTILGLDPADAAANRMIAQLAEAQDGAGKMHREADGLRREGKREELRAHLENILKEAPGNTAVLFELASLYLDAGYPKRALRRLHLYLQENPTDVEILEMAAVALGALGNPEKAKAVTEEIQRLRQGKGA